LEVESSGAGHWRLGSAGHWLEEEISGTSLLLTEACQYQDAYRQRRE
jgi:hypothetical protein